MQPLIHNFINFILFNINKEITPKKCILNQMAERFSQKNLRVRPSSDEDKIVTNAKKHFEKL